MCKKILKVCFLYSRSITVSQSISEGPYSFTGGHKRFLFLKRHILWDLDTCYERSVLKPLDGYRGSRQDRGHPQHREIRISRHRGGTQVTFLVINFCFDNYYLITLIKFKKCASRYLYHMVTENMLRTCAGK